MYIVKKILIKSAISLFAGLASAVGMRAGSAIWDGCVDGRTYRKTREPLT